MVLFDEFCNWAITKTLDLPDDDDEDFGGEKGPAVQALFGLDRKA